MKSMKTKLKALTAALLLPTVLLTGCQQAFQKVNAKRNLEKLSQCYTDDSFEIVSTETSLYGEFTSDKIGERTFSVHKDDNDEITSDYYSEFYHDEIEERIFNASNVSFDNAEVYDLKWFDKATPIEVINIDDFMHDYVWFIQLNLTYDELPSDEELTADTVDFMREMGSPLQLTIYVYLTNDSHSDPSSMITLTSEVDADGHIESIEIEREDKIFEGNVLI